jgi:hypothetical protein
MNGYIVCGNKLKKKIPLSEQFQHEILKWQKEAKHATLPEHFQNQISK